MEDQDTPGRPKTSVIIKLVELRKDVGVLQRHDLEHAASISALETATVEHRMRLENGVKVFADQKDRLTTVEERVAPKVPSIIKIVGITLAVVSMGAGALWGLSNRLRDRPTIEQVEKVINTHDGNGHKATVESIGQIRLEQTQQRTLIGNIDSKVKDQVDKLDEILDRVPKRRRR
jgi:hypothetical protein